MLTLYCTWGNKRPPRGYRVPLTITILKALHLWLLVFIPLVQYVSFSFFWYTYFSYSPKWSAQRKLSSFWGGRSSSFVLLSANPVKIFTELSLMGFISSAMKPWFCYKRFIFVLSVFLCNTAEIQYVLLQIKGFILSWEELSTVTAAMCGDSKVLSVSVCIYRPILWQ